MDETEVYRYGSMTDFLRLTPHFCRSKNIEKKSHTVDTESSDRLGFLQFGSIHADNILKLIGTQKVLQFIKCCDADCLFQTADTIMYAAAREKERLRNFFIGVAL